METEWIDRVMYVAHLVELPLVACSYAVETVSHSIGLAKRMGLGL